MNYIIFQWVIFEGDLLPYLCAFKVLNVKKTERKGIWNLLLACLKIAWRKSTDKVNYTSCCLFWKVIKDWLNWQWKNIEKGPSFAEIKEIKAIYFWYIKYFKSHILLTKVIICELLGWAWKTESTGLTTCFRPIKTIKFIGMCAHHQKNFSDEMLLWL